jgi:hypothetical protein
MKARAHLAAVVAVVAAWGCSSPSASPSDAGTVDESPVIGCLNDPRDDTYVQGLAKAGKSGQLQFVLVSSDPAPPAVGNNTWVVKIVDAKGAPVTGATFPSITAFMPDHGHGSQAKPVATDNGDGTYTITPLYLFMGGLWQITLQAQSGAATDSAVYSFCIQG